MNLLTLDFETFWSTDFTLSKMTTSAYVRQLTPELVHGCAFKWNEDKPFWVDGTQLKEYLKTINWADTIALAHHAHFDGAILNWVYGHKPAFWLDTLSMARAYFPGESVSLSKLKERLGIREKRSYILDSTKGITPWDMTPQQKANMAEYAMEDIDCYDIYQILKPHFPFKELQLIDMTVRQFTEPVMHLNEDMLKHAYIAEMERKQEMLAYAETHRDIIGSNPQFAELLIQLGVEPPMKLSPAALKREEEVWTYAFSKSDEEFIALKEHDDPRVVALVEARLAVKSTIMETRTTRMMALGSPAPFYYNYYGAHSGRWSGGDKLNPQNFSRGKMLSKEEKQMLAGKSEIEQAIYKGSALRESIIAPPGHVVIVRDLSQIEARMLALVAGQDNVVAQFARNEDVYSLMATTIFGRTVDRKKNPDDFIPGFIGKATVLGCGYGLGWLKFQGMIRVGMLGMKGILFDEKMLGDLGADFDQVRKPYIWKQVEESKPFGLTIDQHAIHCACALHIINVFRDNNPYIVDLWDAANTALDYMLEGTEYIFGVGVQVATAKDSILMPNGMYLKYPKLACRVKGKRREFSVSKRRGRTFITTKVYGGLVTENLIQALSRIVIAHNMLTMRAEGMHVAMHTHDEIVVVAPEAYAEATYNRMGEIMGKAPDWCERLPLASEGGWAHNYSK